MSELRQPYYRVRLHPSASHIGKKLDNANFKPALSTVFYKES